ncbi:amino acid adenylation domain protein [Drechmeria coniospora]|uniref:Amino acid adenylation domain protein n=1 Tax=Drechmeria coniospora TaxID=98403 RepID=A0A151GJL7_DRECN|nr:amino acid adenylation domain protein [Drechmeria coniospora]KYK57278.1 amino acid adenylation domain protein [Drechmeria coniospora]
MFTVIDGKVHLEEYAPDDVNPEVRVVFRQDSAIAEEAMTRILRRPFSLRHELSARWVILQDAKAFRIYIVAHHIVMDGQAMTNISREFLALLDDPKEVLPSVVAFNTMHMAERAWAMSQAYLDNQRVLLDQVRGKSSTPWEAKVAKPSTSSDSYRKIDSWCTFRKSELDVWSQMFRTSWFRVATALVGLLVVDKAKPQFGKDEVLSIGFGSRPKGMGACIGQFANALPVKVPLWDVLHQADGSFKALVSAVGKNISAVKRAELFPAVDVVRSCRDLNIDYSPPRVTVTYSPKLARSECRLFPVEGSWDLFFCFLEYEDDVKLGVIYNPQIFSAATLKAMKTQFDEFSAISKVEGATLTEMLPWLPRHANLPMRSPQRPANPLKHVHHWFDAHAESCPDSLALYSSELALSMTYGELYTSTEAKAKFLRNNDIGRGHKVLINLPRGFAIIEWIFSILKCGAAFVYLDVDATTKQRTAIIANCKPALVIDESLVQEVVSFRDGKDISMEQAKFATADDDLAYMIYTSGSTGEPKGVMVEHGSLSAFTRASTEIFELGFGTRTLQLASFSFDASILEWSSTLCSGGCLCFSQHPKQLVGEYLGEVIEKNSISFLQITPTALETLPLTMELPSLRQISVGGEAPSREIFAKWHPRVNLVNAYGPTEATIAVSFEKLDKSERLPDAITAGHINQEMDVHICAEGFGSIVKAGVEGEICVSGPQVARGYCDMPEATAKNFAVHSTGVRMYRTGDHGMMLENGSLLVMGRIDREIKVRGFRIAAEEIEVAIMDSNVGIQEASVQLSANGLEMLAFVAPKMVSPEGLRDSLKLVLPSYKIPSRIYVVDDLPKNINGKIDHRMVRKNREELIRSHAPEAVEFLDSESEVDTDVFDASGDEAVVGKIWQDVLGMACPPPSDVNFFDIGGHSLLVPKLHDKLKAAFPDKPVRLVELFHKSTISSQAVIFGAQSSPARGVRRRTKTPIVKTPMSTGSSASTANDTPPWTRTAATSVTDVANTPELAIVGIAGRFPGAQNVDEFYQMLMDGKSGVQQSPSATDRETLPGNVWVPKAGVLDKIEDFDHEFWKLTEEDATEMDPQQRLFMEVVYEALVDADIDTSIMDGGRIGMFVGAANHAYHLQTESVATDAFLRENRGFVAPSISARTAYHLNIRGPNVTIQTNCASSTVALSQAFDAIRLGRCDMAVVGGVSVQLYEGGYVTQQGQIFSPRGECNPFDSRADGTVPADAVTAVVLKRYSTAVVDGTPVYAKVLGTGIGSDGALDKAGYQVPSPRGQADVIKSAWVVAGLTPERLKYAEIHGSGTPIGDALELEGLRLAMTELSCKARRFTVGSTKGNIGNAQHASGLVSLVKLCKSMQAGVVPATKGLEQMNPMINPDLDLVLATQQTKLSPDDILAVSAAGWGGVDSHIVLGFPGQHMLKRTTRLISATTFRRKTLKAPRLSRQTPSSTENSTSVASLVFSRCASDILGVEVGADTDLKRHGLDSKSYVAIAGAASKQLNGPSIGVRGFLAPICTPSTLANMYDHQLSASGRRELSCAMIQDGQGMTIICLPGTGGSCAGATSLLESLPEGVKILVLEHPGDPSSDQVEGYVEAVGPHVASSKMLLVGISAGGLSALHLSAALRTRYNMSMGDIGLVALDSPRIDTWPGLEMGSVGHAAFIGASAGQMGTDELVRTQWEKAVPGIEMHELACGHVEIWGRCQASSTASLVKDVMLKMVG